MVVKGLELERYVGWFWFYYLLKISFSFFISKIEIICLNSKVFGIMFSIVDV